MDTPPPLASSYVISIRVEQIADGSLAWRGALITAAGQRLHFSTLTQLNGWLCELTGWQDPPQDGERGLPKQVDLR